MKEEETKIIKEEHKFTSDEKLTWWGTGEWVEEVDYLEFEYKGFDCLIRRMACQDGPKGKHIFGGYLCGYVKIPESHNEFGKIDNFESDLDVHGGVTFSEFIENNFFIGFDCAHSGDYHPSMEKFKKENPFKSPFDLQVKFKRYDIFIRTYKNINFCIEQCKLLVDQLIQEKVEL